jgi:HPt (histidine-containing phosphotransfer) domain-containing protein
MARLMNDEELVGKIIQGFLEDIPKQIKLLAQAIGQKDMKRTGGQSHTIKGAAANVGGMALSAVASEMEKAARADRPDEIAALLPELERQFDLLRLRLVESGS